jgi:hypothetical protein
MNTLIVPKGSQIKTDVSPDGTMIQWKNRDDALNRVAVAAFLLVWLGLWVTGEMTTAQKLWSDFQQGNPLETFLLLWLCGWTLGGLFAVTFLFALLRGVGRSRLLLCNYELTYNPGRMPVSAIFQRNRKQMINPYRILAGRKPVTARKQDITKLQIGYAGDQLRLTFDMGAQRIEVGEYLTEPEKEWLHKTIESWLG